MLSPLCMSTIFWSLLISCLVHGGENNFDYCRLCIEKTSNVTWKLEKIPVTNQTNFVDPNGWIQAENDLNHAQWMGLAGYVSWWLPNFSPGLEFENIKSI